jgi:beta-barrel assembly-enhancing protease
MHGTWRNCYTNSALIVVAAASLLLAGCTGGRNSISYLLEQEKTQIRSRFAKNIGSSPQELQRAFDSSRETEKLAAVDISKRVVARLGQSQDKAMQKHLQAVVQRLVEPLNSHSIDYKVILVKEDQINAFTPGGGIIVVHDGLLMHSDTEGQVAAVLAHEIAHILRRHPLRQRQYSVVRKAGRSLTDAITPDAVENSIGKVLKLGGGATLNAAVRAQEQEADSIAIDILVAAGYDPKEMVNVQKIFRQYAPQSSRLANLIYGSHPLSKDREMAALKKIAESYPGVGGDVTSAQFNKLIRPYLEKRMKRVAEKL